MPNAISLEVRNRTLAMLRKGRTRKYVARTLGVSLSWVDRTAHQLVSERIFDQQAREVVTRRHEIQAKAVQRYAQRCPHCGLKVLLPCLKCAADKTRRNRQVIREVQSTI